MSRMRILLLTAALIALAGSLAWRGAETNVHAQNRTPAAQDEFVPMSEVPESEKLPAAPLVIGAYAFIWLAALAYLGSIWRRLGAVDREIAQLRRDVARG